MFKKIILSIIISLFPFAAQAQALTPACSRPPPSFGVVWTPTQWIQCLSSFQAFLGYTPLNAAGGTMSGELTLQQSVTTNAPITMPPGFAPTSPVNGDLWQTSAGLFYRSSGVTIGPLVSSGSLSLIIGSTAITSGTTTRVLYDNAGVLGEYSVTGTGSVALSNTPTFVTPVLGAASGTSLSTSGASTFGTGSTDAATVGGGSSGGILGSTGGDLFAAGSSGDFFAGGTSQAAASFEAMHVASAVDWIIAKGGTTGAGGFLTTNIGPISIGSAGGTTNLTDAALNISGTATVTGKVVTAATATGGAGLILPPGTAPTSPVNGDIWTTSTGLFAQINGTTVGPYLSSASLPPAVVWSDTPLTSNTAVTANSGSCVNTSGGAVTITLPTTPTAGTLVELDDCNQTFGTNAMTVAPGGSDKIMGVAANLLDNRTNWSVLLRYNAAQTNWLIIP